MDHGVCTGNKNVTPRAAEHMTHVFKLIIH
jgi:hypothetical protein